MRAQPGLAHEMGTMHLLSIEALLGTASGGTLSDWQIAVVALVGSLVVVEVAYRILRGVAAKPRGDGAPERVLAVVLKRTKHAVEALAVSIAGLVAARLAPASMRTGLVEAARVAVILSVTWIAAGAVSVVVELATRHFDLGRTDNRDARRAVTQLGLIRRVAVVVVVVIGGLVALTSLPAARAVGASLLASAGVLTIVAGIAGQSTLGNVIAGLQVAFSDALRLDDVVVVQGDWGRIEQITLTYVVVKVWDERRLVLPVSYFVTTPFENWTRSSAELLGSVFLYVDYTVPVDELRKELASFVADHPLWDRRVATLQVVDTTEKTVQLRVLVSSANSNDSWNLRCEVREHLLQHLQDHHPEALPRVRLDPSPPGARHDGRP